MKTADLIPPSPVRTVRDGRLPSPLRRRRAAGAGLILALGLAGTAPAQPDCRSVLGAHLKPVAPESPVSWAGELVTIPAYLENRYATNSMLLAGIDVTTRSKAHQFYFEGGAKRSAVSSTSDHDTTEVVAAAGETGTAETHLPTGTNAGAGKGKAGAGGPGTGESTSTTGETASATAATQATKYSYGWRELFYQYRSETTRLRAGLSTTRLGDTFLVNERMFGVSYVEQFGRASLHFAAGSVAEYARMTEFCGTKRLTNLVEKDKYETVSEDLGDTNLAGAVVTWDLRRAASPTPAAPTAARDEFSLSDDLVPARTARLGLAEVGVIAYHETDRRTDDHRTWLGGLARFDLPGGVTLKTQALYQDGVGPDAWITFAQAERDFVWGNASRTTVHAGYFGKRDIGAAARFEASFTNLFKGEIMRMDAIDMPLAFAGVRHQFPGRRKLYLQLQGVNQLNAEKMQEVDLELGADFFKRLRVVAIGSHIRSLATRERDNLVAKMELRFGF